MKIKTGFYYLLLMVLLPVCAKAGEDWHAEGPSWRIQESKPDESLKNTESVFELKFFGYNGLVKTAIKLSYNGKEKTVIPTNGIYKLKVKPGNYKFQLWYNKQHHEITTDSIETKPAHRTKLDIYFKSTVNHTQCRKPVIYLYPQQPTEVNVQLKTFNPFTFTYPAYDSITGWKVKAYPDGTLEQNGKQFNYLFWEGKSAIETHPYQRHGFVLNKTELTTFFEEKLAYIGLSTNEVQDFITYWVPELQKHEKVYLYFIFNEEYDRYVKMTVNPKPDQLIRVMMLWEPYSPYSDPDSEIRKQELPHYERKGFTLVEWGGAEIRYLMKCKF